MRYWNSEIELIEQYALGTYTRIVPLDLMYRLRLNFVSALQAEGVVLSEHSHEITNWYKIATAPIVSLEALIN